MARAISVKLEAFEGPLDLLLHLIDKNKIDIYDIPIVEITRQYMDYIKEMQKADLNVMSEFLVMAATLLDIKSRMLLPVEDKEEEEDGDPRQELVDQLLQYKMYKFLSSELREREGDSEFIMYHDKDLPQEVREYTQPVNMDELVGDLTLAKLNRIFQDIMKRKEYMRDPVRSNFGRIEKEEVNLGDKISLVRRYAQERGKFSFCNLLEEQASKMQVVVTFLAILELMKTGEIRISQEEIFGDIEIERVYNGEEKVESE
jgi:segregation and condensation protein A